MRLRTKIFLLIGGLFTITTIIFAIFRQIQITDLFKNATNELKEQIIEIDKKQRENILAYLSINVAEIESRINTLFNRIQQLSWMKQKYAPTDFNYRTNDWASASVLMASNQWIDFIQTVARDKLTSQIISSPPYLHQCIRVALDDFLSVFFFKNKQGKYDSYIGVPYWSNSAVNHMEMGVHEMIFTNKKDRDQWLIFSFDALMSIKKGDLVLKNPEIPAGPLEPSLSIKGEDLFQNIVRLTTEMVFLTQEKIAAYPEWMNILSSPKLTNEWAEKNIQGPLKGSLQITTDCTTYLCQMYKEKYNEAYLQEMQNWAFRYDQDQLVWEIATITASGIWDFNPLEAKAPKGIVSFERRGSLGVTGSEPYYGLGLLCKDVFYDQKIDVVANCIPLQKQGEDNTCISTELQIVNFHDDRGVFLTNTLLFDREVGSENSSQIGTLTLGVRLNPILQKLALASRYNVLFIDREGKGVVFDEKGSQDIKHSKWQNANFEQMIYENSGTIKDLDGNEFLFIHITSLTEDDGHVFVVELQQSAFEMLKALNEGSKSLFFQITYEFIGINLLMLIILLLLLNQILKKVITPIQELATTTKAIGKGHLSSAKMPEKSLEREDEIGDLCRSFKQMIEEMKQGEKVRDILNKVVSKEVAEKIISGGVELGGETREVTVLFSDIRNFTHITEKMQPHEVLDLLNDCLTVLSRVIDDHMGVIDKYVGDEIMALFGAPIETKNAALEAVLCAIEMREVLTGWNRQRKRRGLLTLDIGIGIHTGFVISGNIGAENHLNYTVLGHNVNVASRVCSYAKEMEILITEATLNAPLVKEKISYIPLEPVMLKGISTPVQIYRIP